MDKPFIIAIDGPAASGKGTLAKKLASYFELPYLDTGKLYRAVAYRVLQTGMDAVDSLTAQNLTSDELANPALSDESVGTIASTVAAIPQVRSSLLAFQKSFALQLPGAILDGRDIGTVICPDAPIKLFVTASLEERAQRRFKELQNKQLPVIYEAVLQDLRDRDQRDMSRAASPLAIPQDAHYIDTSNMDADAAFNYALHRILPHLNPYCKKMHHAKLVG